MNPVTARLRPEIDHRIADPSRCSKKDLVLVRYTETKDVDQWILRINIVENDFAADSRHPHTIPVSSYTRHDTLHEMTVLGCVEATKPQPRARANNNSDFSSILDAVMKRERLSYNAMSAKRTTRSSLPPPRPRV